MHDAARRRVIALLLACTALHACARTPDNAPPVATPSVVLSRTTVPAGHLIDVTYRFTVADNAPALADDYTVFVHVVDEDGEGMWADDHQPAIPTRQWKPGERVEYSRPLFVSRRALQGRFALEIGLYSPRTGERLPLAGTTAGGRAYRAATFDVIPTGPIPVVAFFSGWHEGERYTGPGARLGIEWRWSTRESWLWCPHPRADAQFVLNVDQPIQGSDRTRSVQIHIGGSLVDEFQLAPGAQVIRRIPVTAAALGTDDIVKILLTVDTLVVPAEMPGSGSTDTRALGVRVLDAFLEPIPVT